MNLAAVLSGWLERFSIRAVLLGGFILVVGMTLTLGIVSWRGQQRSVEAANRLLDVDGRIVELSLSGLVAMHKARRAEKDFRLLWREFGYFEARSRYVTLLQMNVADLREYMEDARRLSSEPDVHEQTYRIEQAVGTYEAELLKAIQLYGQLGYAGTGLEGSFRIKARELETIVGRAGEVQLLADLMMLRRHEKNFILRGSNKYVVSVRNSVARLKADAAASRLSAASKHRVTGLADDYRAEFERYVEVDQQIEAASETYLAAAHSVEPLLENLYLVANQLAAATRAGVSKTARIIAGTIIWTSLAAVLLGIFVTLFVSYGIAKSVRECVDFAGRIARGDLDTKISPKGRNEFATLAVSMNAMSDALQTSRASLEREANFDALTGLANRNLLLDRIAQAIANAKRQSRSVAIALLDIDQFKLVNDGAGHNAGDALLKIVAERLKTCVRRSDTVARLGGDEFVLVLPDQAGWETSSRVVQRIAESVSSDPHVVETVQRVLSVVATPVAVEGQEMRVTCSMGLSIFPQDGEDAEVLLKNADAAMYRAKDTGRNNFQFYAAEMNARTRERLAMQAQLHRALEADEFLLHYQPKVDLKSGHIMGLEALIRWNSPERGLVAPDRFIPVLEQCGMMNAVGRWVIERALLDYTRGLQEAPNFPRVAVNVSPVQLMQKDFVAMLEMLVQVSGIQACGLDIEITESLVMRNIEDNVAKLKAVRKMGINIAVDDFGTGYSSLSYLAKLPVDTLKIDRAFITNLEANSDNATIVTAIISLAHTLKLKVVAEGVETEEQKKLLALLKCDAIQGYLVSRPVPLGQIIELVKRTHIRAH